MTTTPAAESALVVPVPVAESVVEPWRERLDPACVLGLPAHVTVLYPFVPPPGIDDAMRDELRELFGSCSRRRMEFGAPHSALSATYDRDGVPRYG